MQSQVQDADWENEIAVLLDELSGVQTELLRLLSEKRQLLATADMEGLAALRPAEQEMIDRLTACQERRGSLLARAAEEGMPATNVRTLAASLPQAGRGRFAGQLKEAASRARLLQHQSLTNWVLVQRTLIHLSQMLEIIATGGRPKPTYGRSQYVESSGSLVDRAA